MLSRADVHRLLTERVMSLRSLLPDALPEGEGPPTYEVREHATKGLRLVAARPIRMGDVILCEEPLVIAPTLYEVRHEVETADVISMYRDIDVSKYR